MNYSDGDKLKWCVHALLNTRPAKGKVPQPAKRDIKRRFRLDVMRGKPRMVAMGSEPTRTV